MSKTESMTLRKSLGQHFLQDENIARKIIHFLGERPFHQLLEVGPGAGALTKFLLNIENVQFKAVEVDKEKVSFLLDHYPRLASGLLHEDFLKMQKPFDGPFTIIGNFPYQISTQIVFRVLEWRNSVECMIGMFQKEVAKRIQARHGSKTYGILSVLVQAFFEVEYLLEVGQQCFNPPPKVKSAVIRLIPKSTPVEMHSEKDFYLLVKTAFNQRRKTLRNALKNLFDPASLARSVFDQRAEQLSVADLAGLTYEMKHTHN